MLQGFGIVNYQANSLNKYIELTFPKAAGFQLFLSGVEFNFPKSKQYRSSRCARAACWVCLRPRQSANTTRPLSHKFPLRERAGGFPVRSDPNSPKKCYHSMTQALPLVVGAAWILASNNPHGHINSSQWKPSNSFIKILANRPS